MKTLIRSLSMFGALLILAACGNGGGGGAGAGVVNTPDITVTDSVVSNIDLQVPFGTVRVGLLSDETVTITNDGTADLVIGAIASADTLAAPFGKLTDSCSNQTIALGGSCTLTVRFSPTAAVAYTDSFDIPSNDPDENPVTVSVSGTGSAAPAPGISVSPASIDFFAVCFTPTPQVATRSVTITSMGTANLNITSTVLGGSTNYRRVNNCPASLPPAQSCTVAVTFAPTSSAGQKNGTLTINSNAPARAVSLTGEALNCN